MQKFLLLALIPLVLGILKGIVSFGTFIAIAGGVSYLSGQLVDWGIRFQNTLLNPANIPIIQTTWQLLRDFVNIFFILILLVIAFATIFNIKNYKASDLLPQLIIAALLINFSLVITGWVIDLLWVPAGVFLEALGRNVSGKIVEALKISSFFSSENLALLFFNLFQGDRGVIEITVREGVFRGILLIVNAFLLSWIALILWIRIPILLGLMIVSPFAWLGYTLPAIKKQTWDAWWQKLFCWGSIPIPLFGLIYFVALFNQRLRLEIYNTPLEPFLNTVLPFLGLTLGQILIWVITAGIFLGGLMYIKGLSCSLYGWVNKAFFGTWKDVRKGVGWTTDTLYQATGYKDAVGQVQKEFKEGGIPIFGRRMFGTAQRKAREAKIEDQLRAAAGLGPRFVAQKDLLEKADKETKDLENILKASTKAEADRIITDLKKSVAEKSEKGKEIDAQTLAAITTLAKRGELDKPLFDNAAKQLEKLPLALTKVFSDWKEGKFGGLTSKEFLEIARRDSLPAETRRTAYAFLATEDAKIVTRDMTDKDYQKGYEILGKRNTKEGRDFKKNIGKLRPTIVAQYNLEHLDEEIVKPEDRDKIRAEKPEDQLAAVILNQIEGSSAKEMGDFDKKEWDNENFKKALNKMIKNKEKVPGAGRQYVQEMRRRFIREGKDKQLEALNSFGNVKIAESQKMAGGARKTPGGIILEPGAQFEMEREEEESQKKIT